jgi:hypothetical protein
MSRDKPCQPHDVAGFRASLTQQRHDIPQCLLDLRRHAFGDAPCGRVPTDLAGKKYRRSHRHDAIAVA